MDDVNNNNENEINKNINLHIYNNISKFNKNMANDLFGISTRPDMNTYEGKIIIIQSLIRKYLAKKVLIKLLIEI